MANPDFNIFIKDTHGYKNEEYYNPVIEFLKGYFRPVFEAAKSRINAINIKLAAGESLPTVGSLDVIVYVVPRLSKSVIAINKGPIDLPTNNKNVLGLTDVTNNICEVYLDRLYEESKKEMAGAIYHEAAHAKSRLGQSMHSQKGFLGESPDYNGQPSDKNTAYYAQIVATPINQKWVKMKD